jgi:hypothetical protein
MWGSAFCVASTLQPGRAGLGLCTSQSGGPDFSKKADWLQSVQRGSFYSLHSQLVAVEAVGRGGWPAVGWLIRELQRFDVGRNLTPQCHKRATTAQPPRLISTPRHCYCGHQTIERPEHNTQFTAPSVSFIFTPSHPPRRVLFCSLQHTNKRPTGIGNGGRLNWGTWPRHAGSPL